MIDVKSASFNPVMKLCTCWMISRRAAFCGGSALDGSLETRTAPSIFRRSRRGPVKGKVQFHRLASEKWGTKTMAGSPALNYLLPPSTLRTPEVHLLYWSLLPSASHSHFAMVTQASLLPLLVWDGHHYVSPTAASTNDVSTLVSTARPPVAECCGPNH